MLDWSLLQSFLAVAEEGSLSAAARRLGLSQPTLGRQVKAIETTLGTPVFKRHAKGLDLSDFGQTILPSVQAMQAAANDIRLAAASRETDLSGTVRITASQVTAHANLPAVVAIARRAYPKIQIDIIPTDDSENLIFGEADIALRMYRPTQLDLITQFIGEITMGLFAATTYLDRVGRPKGAWRVEDILKLDLIGYDQDRRIIEGMNARGFPANREMFSTRCDDHVVQWELIVQGCGAGFYQTPVGLRTLGIEQIPLPIPNPTLPIWLTASSAMRQTPRIRAIWEILARELPKIVSEPPQT